MTSAEADANEAVFLAKCKRELAAIHAEQGTERERLQRVFERKEREMGLV